MVQCRRFHQPRPTPDPALEGEINERLPIPKTGSVDYHRDVSLCVRDAETHADRHPANEGASQRTCAAQFDGTRGSVPAAACIDDAPDGSGLFALGFREGRWRAQRRIYLRGYVTIGTDRPFFFW